MSTTPDDTPTVDVLVQNEGTIFLFAPLTAAAREWIEENVGLAVQ